MLRSMTLAAAALLAFLAPAQAPAHAGAAAAERTATSITGTWKGAVINEDGPAGYTGRVHIRRTDTGYAATARYGEMGRSRWAYQGRDHGWFLFRERMQGSQVVVDVRVQRDGARLVVRWRDAHGYTGHMRARRV